MYLSSNGIGIIRLYPLESESPLLTRGAKRRDRVHGTLRVGAILGFLTPN